jgi:hypothetical protein
MLLLYQVRGISLDVLFGQRCGWWGYVGLTLCVIAGTAVLAALTDRIYRALDSRTRPPPRPAPPALQP